MVDTVFIEGSGAECDVTLDTWLKDSLPNLPGALRSVAARELVLAGREFFERSYAWTDMIENQNAVAGRKQYWTSPFDQYSNVIAVLWVAFRGIDLARFPRRPSRRTNDSGVPNDEADLPTGYYADVAPDAIELWPDIAEGTQNLEGVLTFHVALTPKTTVEHLPRIAEIKFYDAILDGFLARMYMHPNKPYSSPQLAAAKRQNFNHWIGRYMGQAKGGYITAQNWSFPPSWGVRRFGQVGQGGG